jgi:hypothetical protein
MASRLTAHFSVAEMTDFDGVEARVDNNFLAVHWLSCSS